MPNKYRKELFFKLGWNLFSYMNPTQNSELNKKVKSNLLQKVNDLNIMNRDEFISLDDNEVVDIVERRIKWRFSDEEYSIFMIGFLSPALVEHHSNKNYKMYLENFYKAIGKENKLNKIFGRWAKNQLMDIEHFNINIYIGNSNNHEFPNKKLLGKEILNLEIYYQ